MKQLHVLHGNTNSQKLKADQNFFFQACSQMGLANLVSGLNLNVSRE